MSPSERQSHLMASWEGHFIKEKKNPFAYLKKYVRKLQKQTYQCESFDCSPLLTSNNRRYSYFGLSNCLLSVLPARFSHSCMERCHFLCIKGHKLFVAQLYLFAERQTLDNCHKIEQMGFLKKPKGTDIHHPLNFKWNWASNSLVFQGKKKVKISINILST